jgi:hypothetical protein
MSESKLSDSVWFKIALAMIPVCGIVISMWADVRSMKADRTVITDGRLVRLEEQEKAQDKQIEDIKHQLQALWSRRSEPRHE